MPIFLPLVHDGLMEADPQFVAPGLEAPPEGFRLEPGSPAIAQGLADVAPATYLAGASRSSTGPVDPGAYQHSARP